MPLSSFAKRMEGAFRMKQFLVVYTVKYSELWGADECHWVEESMVCSARSKKEARKVYREDIKQRYTRILLGRHISTRQVTAEDKR